MNCKPGDLAYIVEGLDAGAIVEVIEIDYDWSELPSDVHWGVVARGFIHTVTPDGKPRFDKEFSIEDRLLRPITGIPTTGDVTDEVVA